MNKKHWRSFDTKQITMSNILLICIKVKLNKYKELRDVVKGLKGAH